jgi:hypothetical protein
LAHGSQRLWHIRMAWAEGPRGPLAMDEEASGRPVQDMLLDFAGVMRDVVEQREGVLRQNICEHLPDEMRDDLTVGKRAVDPCAHRAEIILPHFRIDRGGRQFTIRQFDVVPRRAHGHAFEKLRADLMPESARAAMDAHDEIAFAEAENCRRLRIEHGHDLLHFEVVVPGAERAHLILLPLLGVIRDIPRLGAGHAAVLFD